MDLTIYIGNLRNMSDAELADEIKRIHVSLLRVPPRTEASRDLYTKRNVAEREQEQRGFRRLREKENQ